MDYKYLIQQALEIRNETGISQNTAIRVGDMLIEIINALKDGGMSETEIQNLIMNIGSKLYLSKTEDDTAAGHIVFMKGLTSKGKTKAEDGVQFGEKFDPNILTGFGGNIDGNGNGVLESLILRRFLEVPELRYNRVEVKVGDKWRAPGAGIIERVIANENGTGTAFLKLEKGEIGLVKEGDICMGIFHDETPNSTKNSKVNSATSEPALDSRGNRKFAGFFTVYFTVTEVFDTADNANGSFSYRLRKTDGTEGVWSTSFHPCEAMHFVVYGNFTNKERQTSVYETLTYTRMLRDQDTWEITSRNIGLQYGDMTNLYVHGYEADGYSLMANNVFITGNLKHIKDNGKEVNNINLLPDYTPGQHVDFYDAVVYNGETWICIAGTGTTTTPSDADPAWKKLVEKPNSITGAGRYVGGKNYVQGSIVNFAGKLWICNKDTSRPPYDLYLSSDGKYLQTSDGNYLIKSYVQDDEQKAAWEMMIDTSGIKDGVNGVDGKSLEVQYSSDKVSWHENFAANDIYMRQRLGDGAWSAAMRIVGESGEDGVDGTWTEFEFSIGNSLTVHPEDGWQDGPVENVPSGCYSWMRSRTHDGKTGEVSPWQYTRIGGEAGKDGEIHIGHLGLWQSGMHVKYLDIVRMGKGTFQCINPDGTDNAPYSIYTSSKGDALQLFDGNYILTGDTNFDKPGADYSMVAMDGADGKTGENGVDGANGRDIEYIYLRTSISDTPDIVDESGTAAFQNDDFLPVTSDGRHWQDNPKGVTEAERYEFVAIRVKRGGAGGKGGSWQPFSNVTLWSAFGERGQDGDGVEYIFARTKTEAKPSLDYVYSDDPANEYQRDDFTPNGWTDDPQGVTSTWKYEWVVQRKSKNGVWQPFEDTIALWAKFSEDGKSLVRVDNFYEWGASGTSAPEFKTAANIIPDKPSDKSYLWNYEVTYANDGSVITRTAASCIGYFPKDGAQGISIVEIKEYYQLTADDKAPSAPTLSADKKTVTLGSWKTTTVVTSDAKRYLWNVEVVKLSDGTYTVGIPHSAGVQGEQGDPGPQGVPGTPGADGVTYYTWIRYADTAAGAGISNDPTGKEYIGFAYKKTSPTESNNPADYKWSLIKGTDGQPGPVGPDGKTFYTWIAYSDYPDGKDMYQIPTGATKYIGIAINKESATEGTNPKDYTWSQFRGNDGASGPQGVPGTPGKDGVTYYTWIRYADNANGSGISNDPSGKKYIGFAYMKTTSTESNNPADYKWSQMTGTDGVPGTPGKDGKTPYTWIKYADNADGTGMYDLPKESTKYIGIAVNKDTPTESNNKADYTWSLFRGADGKDGKDGSSPINLGDWYTGLHVPFLGIVRMGNKTYQCTNPNGTNNPPAWTYITSSGNRLKYKDGSYVLTGQENLAEYSINSVDGVTVYTITNFVFMRSHTKPAKPSGGTFENPLPSGWSESVPDGDSEVWMSYRVFWSDNSGDTNWSDPMKLADTSDIDFDFSKVESNPGTPATKPGNWSNDPTDAIWMATRVYRHGQWDEWRVMKIKGEEGYTPVKGKDYFDNVIADLDNEMDSVITDKDGNFNGSVKLYSNVVMFSGVEQLPLSSVGFSSVTGVTSAVTYSSDKKTGNCSFTVTKAVADHAEVTITVSAAKDGKTYSRNLTFTINKVKQGQTGQNAVLYQLLPSVTAIKVDKAGTVSPSGINCGIVKIDGDSRTKLNSLPSGLSMKVNNGGGDVAYTMGSNYTSYTKATKSVDFSLYSGSTLLDKESTPVVVDGTDGSNGAQGLPASTAQLSTGSLMVLTDTEGKVKGAQTFEIGATLMVGNELKGIDYMTITSYNSSQFDVSRKLSSGYYTGITVTAKNGASGLANSTSLIKLTVGTMVSGKRIDIPLTLAVTGTVAGDQGYNGCSIRAREWSEFAREFKRTISGTTPSGSYSTLTASTLHNFQLVLNNVTGNVVVESYKLWIYNSSGTLVDSGEVTGFKIVGNGTMYQTTTLINKYVNKNYSVKVQARVRFCGCTLASGSYFYAQTYGAGIYKTAAQGNCYINTEAVDVYGNPVYDPSNVIRNYYYNEADVTSKGYGTRYIDIVVLPDESNASGYQAYRCLHSHFANKYNMPKSTAGTDPSTGKTWSYYWEEADVQPFIQTDMLFAKHAKMVFASGNQILLQNEDEDVIGGMSGYGTSSEQIRFWIGHETPSKAPFRVKENGEFVATNAKLENADVSGKVSASSGSIGGFEIGQGRLGLNQTNLNSSSLYGMSLYNDSLIFNAYNRQAIVGTFSILGTNLLGRFTDTTYDSYADKFGLVFNIANGYRNFAISGTGSVVMNGVVEGFKLNRFTPSSSGNVISYKDGAKVLLKGSYSSVFLPYLSNLRQDIGLGSNSSTYFSVRLTIICDTTSEIKVYGYVSSTSGANCPRLYNNDKNEQTSGISMQKGDVLTLELTYDGSTYAAWIVSRSN